MALRQRAVTGIYRVDVPPHRRYVSEMSEAKLWLEAHGIEPNLVPAREATVIIGGGRVSIDVYLTRGGRMYVVGNRAPRGRLTVPLIEDMTLPRCFKITDHTHEGIMT